MIDIHLFWGGRTEESFKIYNDLIEENLKNGDYMSFVKSLINHHYDKAYKKTRSEMDDQNDNVIEIDKINNKNFLLNEGRNSNDSCFPYCFAPVLSSATTILLVSSLITVVIIVPSAYSDKSSSMLNSVLIFFEAN